MIVCGVDPGLSGALAFYGTLDTGISPIDCLTYDMPTLSLVRGGKNKREVDAHSLARLLKSRPIDHAFLEQVGAMKAQGVSSMFSFGKSYGIVIGVLATLEIPMTLVPPVRWKKAMAVPAAKDGARARASQLMPAFAWQWTRVKDDGRAEAACIALYGWRELVPAAGA